MTNMITKDSFRTLIVTLGLVILALICTASMAYADETKTSIESASVTGYNSSYTYEGRPITPNITVKMGDTELEKGVDYEINYANNTNVGKATVRIVGIGEYTSEKSVSFNIVKAEFYKVVKGAIPDQYYTSQEIKPNTIPLYNYISNVRLVKDQDFTIVGYGNNTSTSSSAYVRVSSRNTNYSSGELTIYFSIVPQKMENCTIDSILPVLYNGKAQQPEVVVRSQGIVLPSKDYSITYSNNVNIGEATVIITGGPNCPGTKTVRFKIQAEIQPADVFVSNASYLLGKPVKPNVIIKNGDSVLQVDKDYKIVFLNNTQPGFGTVKVTGIGNYTGIVEKTFNISERNIRQLQLSKIGEYTYNGEYVRPTISVSFIDAILAEGIDYTLSYSNNRLPGYGYVIVKGQGCYRGTARIPFVIKPVPTKIMKCYANKNDGSISLNWNKIASNCKYEVYRNGKKIATTTKNTYKDTKKLVKGRQYKYTIKVIRVLNHEGKSVKLTSESSNTKSVKCV